VLRRENEVNVVLFETNDKRAMDRSALLELSEMDSFLCRNMRGNLTGVLVIDL
jgi:hypothetical protein